MKRFFGILLVIFSVVLFCFAEPHQLPNLTPPTIGTGDKILIDTGYTLDFGEKVFDENGDRESTDSDMIFGDIYLNVKKTFHPKFDVFAELNIIHRNQSGDGWDASGFGLGDLVVGGNTQIKWGILQAYLVLPLGSSIIKDDLDADELPTGGTLYAPFGGTYNLGANFFMPYSSLKFRVGYELTLGREFQDTGDKFNPGNCFSIGVNYDAKFKEFLVGGTFEGLIIGKSKYDGDTIDDTEVSRWDLTGYIFLNKFGKNEFIALTLPLFGDNHFATTRLWIGASFSI